MKAMLSLLLLATLSTPPAFAQSARELLDKAQDRTAAAPVLRRVDASEMIVTAPGLPKQPPQKSVVTVEIDLAGHLARQTGSVGGKEFVMIKQGERAAMKLGSGNWEVPIGPFAQIAKDMGNLFVCEAEVPENKTNAPVWKTTGTEVLNGHDTIVIESDGDSAIPIAQERVSRSMAKAIPDPAQRPSVKVLAYAAKHWIDKADFAHRQALQRSRLQLTLPDGKTQLTQETTTLTTYVYEEVNIQIPDAAQRLLSPKAAADAGGAALK